jgi:nucleotide-binding universal stress UspA family protein
MIDLRRILAPTDFSKHAANALKYGVAFARKFNAELHLLHVVQDLAMFIPDMVAVTPAVAPTVEELSKSVHAAFDHLVRNHDLGGIKVIRQVREGSPFAEIVRYAREAEIDLIVCGTHGRNALMQMLLGGVAEKVVRKAPCPVLTVHHPEHEFVHG